MGSVTTGDIGVTGGETVLGVVGPAVAAAVVDGAGAGVDGIIVVAIIVVVVDGIEVVVGIMVVDEGMEVVGGDSGAAGTAGGAAFSTAVVD